MHINNVTYVLMKNNLIFFLRNFVHLSMKIFWRMKKINDNRNTKKLLSEYTIKNNKYQYVPRSVSVDRWFSLDAMFWFFVRLSWLYTRAFTHRTSFYGHKVSIRLSYIVKCSQWIRFICQLDTHYRHLSANFST